MNSIELSHVSKSFGPIVAVDDLSFAVEHGEIFGLLGPNGAGKTTTIRLILDIYKPDSGQISVLGGEMDEAKKDRIGYMPEDRGLYQDIPLERVLVYLGTLKGLSPEEARQRAMAYLERFDLADHRHKKVKELSKGMQQKAQIIATLLHNPELVIIDEPFSGLDPLNTQIVKELLLDLHGQGITIIMSTHQMHQVEELCDRILLIDNGHCVLYGDLATIRQDFSGHAVLIKTRGELPPIPGAVLEGKAHGNGYSRLALAPEVAPQDVLKSLVEGGTVIEAFEIAVPTLDEIFIRAVSGEGMLA